MNPWFDRMVVIPQESKTLRGGREIWVGKMLQRNAEGHYRCSELCGAVDYCIFYR